MLPSRQWARDGQDATCIGDDTCDVAYDNDPSLTDVPIHVSELEQILNESTKELMKDQRKFSHLMGRVLTTLHLRLDTIQHLNRDINQMRAQSEQVGRASTLNPIDLVRFLSDEQKAQLFKKMEQERLGAMTIATEKAQDAARVAAQVSKMSRHTLLALTQDPGIPAGARQLIHAAIERIDSAVAGLPKTSDDASASNGWPTSAPASPQDPWQAQL